MEARHRAEFAQPPSGESAAELAQRHEAEHQELEQRYQQARTQGRPTLPPAAPRPPATTRDGRQTTTRDKAPDRARGAD